MRTFIALLLVTSLAYAEQPRINGMSPFELGKRHYEAGHYSRALDLFAQAINTAPDTSTKVKAYYFQGVVLFELGLYYSSYLSFRQVLLSADEKNKEIYEKAIKNAVIITDRLNIIERIGKALDRLPPQFIPTSVSAHANYAMGVFHFGTGDDAKSSANFKSVFPESPFYPKAQYYLGILATKTKNYKEAIFYFDKTVQATRGRKDLKSLMELARLNLARSVYSSGDIDRSIELYSQFTSSSPHWLTILLEASWPLMRVNDTTVSLGNLHTVLSPFYREDLVGEGYILRATILFSLCKYEEMRQTLSQFFTIYDPVLRQMSNETNALGPDAFYRAFTTGQGLNRAFINFAKRDEGIARQLRVQGMLRTEHANLARLGRNDQVRKMMGIIEEADKETSSDIGATLMKLHKRKLLELTQQREQANYLKVEIVTGEKELVEGQKGLPPKREVEVETSVAANYHYWPFVGEFWEDELGSYVYTTESACVN